MGLKLWKRNYIVRRMSNPRASGGYVVSDYTDFVIKADIQTTEDATVTEQDGDRSLQKIKVFSEFAIRTPDRFTGTQGDMIFFQDKWFECRTSRLSDNTFLRHYTSTFVECLEQPEPPYVRGTETDSGNTVKYESVKVVDPLDTNNNGMADIAERTKSHLTIEKTDGAVLGEFDGSENTTVVLPQSEFTGKAGIGIGGIKEGTKFDKMDFQTFAELLINQYQKPIISISISPSTTLYELGKTTNQITVTANVTRKSKDIQYVRFYIDNVLADENLVDVSDGGIFTFTAGKYTKNKSFMVVCGDDENSVSASASIKFVGASYYGIIDTTKPTEDDILSLNKRVSATKSLIYSGITIANRRVCYAYPSTFGKISSITDGNGYPVKNSYIERTMTVNGITYYVYVMVDTASLNNGRMTFA